MWKEKHAVHAAKMRAEARLCASIDRRLCASLHNRMRALPSDERNIWRWMNDPDYVGPRPVPAGTDWDAIERLALGTI